MAAGEGAGPDGGRSPSRRRESDGLASDGVVEAIASEAEEEDAVEAAGAWVALWLLAMAYPILFLPHLSLRSPGLTAIG